MVLVARFLLMPVTCRGLKDEFKTVVALSEVKTQGENGFPPNTASARSGGKFNQDEGDFPMQLKQHKQKLSTKITFRTA